MASAKRKQDEKHLKILRELSSKTCNKECFDCRQRGPTYVNMTIGSFVCTSCSGMLRGLTPPHRVKSISMATFTQEEIDFVKDHGNERCRRIWLALLDSKLPQILDTKDEQKMKDLMSAKYEHKRWYLDPSLTNKNSDKRSNENSGENIESNNIGRGTSQSSIPRVPQVGTFATPAIISGQRNKHPTESVDAFAPDFVADFSKLPDPFQAATTTSSRFAQPIIPQPSFANFDNNPAFDSSNSMAELPGSLNQSFGIYNLSNCNNRSTNATPSEDRYAALKDLDSLMKQTQLREEAPTAPSGASPWTTTCSNNSNASNSLWAGNDQTNHVIANPFATGELWQPSANLLNNNMQSIESSLCNSINPFRAAHTSGNRESQWMKMGSAGGADVIPSSQPTNMLSGKVWQPSVSSYRANPFTVGTGIGNVVRNSNNPFL